MGSDDKTERLISEEEALKLYPECIRESKPQITLPPGRKYTARDLMKLSLQERDKLLAEAAEKAAKDYASDEDLNDFNAYDEVDVIEEYGLACASSHKNLSFRNVANARISSRYS